MRTRACHWLWIAAWLAGAAFPACAGEFAPPAEGPVAFRRDRIPLDAEAMTGLSRQLEALADEMKPENPAERRVAAQVLALSMALDPANSKARRLVAEYQEERHKPAEERARTDKSRTRIWQTINWLDSPEAGSEAHALAACLKDVMAVLDPKDPKSEAILNAGEKGAWSGWIPPLSAYQKKPPEVAGGDGSKKTDIPGMDNAGHKDILLHKAQVGTLLWNRPDHDENATWTLSPSVLHMTAEKVEKGKPEDKIFSISIGEAGDSNHYNQLEETIKHLLAKCHGELPLGARITIGGKDLEKSISSDIRRPIGAAAAVLASSAITGIEPDAIILGDVTESGALKLPTGIWDQLQSLGKGSGRRLVLPAEAAAYLPSILAMERPGFFLEYEVLLASDFKQMLEMTAKTPRGAIASPILRFHEVQDRAGTQEVRQYIANSFVRQRLLSIFQECPDHISAKMLLIQASGNRPVLIPRQILAAELRRALESASWLLRKENDMAVADAANVIRTYETCRARVEALERYAEKKDRDLLERARATVSCIRTIDKALRARGEYVNNTSLANSARYEFVRSHRELREALANEMGEGKAANNH